MLTEDRQVLVNLEINKDCQLTKVCGQSCFLNLVEQSLPGVHQLSPDTVLNAAREVIDHGHSVRHLALVGKEPLDTPDILFDILRYYHFAPEETRPGSIGVITSGLQMKQHLEAFNQTPLDWCGVSLDAASSGLHVEHANSRLLHDLLSMRQSKGTGMALVNTVFTENNHDAVIKLGQWVCESGADQWALSAIMSPQNNIMRPNVSLSAVRCLIDRTVNELGNVRNQVLFALELTQFQEITGLTAKDRWRVEHNVPGTNIWLIAANFDQGYFVRLRWDGQLLTKQDFRQLGLKQSTFGSYYPGRLNQILDEFARVESTSVS